MKNIPINFSICSSPPPPAFTPQQCVQSKSLFSSFIKADLNVLKYLALIDLPFSRHGARPFFFFSFLFPFFFLLPKRARDLDSQICSACPRPPLIAAVALCQPRSDHSEAPEEGEEGQEETAGGAGVRVQEERAGGAHPEAAVALGQHALTQRSDSQHSITSAHCCVLCVRLCVFFVVQKVKFY